MNKYRAWDKNDKKMRKVETISFLTDFIECELDLNDDPVKYHDLMCVPLPESEYILMQSTGLKDKNGVEIFEGDVVRRKYNSINYDMEYYDDHIVFQDKTGAWRIKYENGTLANVYDVKKAVEVIGNIHENPELLKEVE